MQFDAPFGELNRECCRMRTLFCPTLDCLVRDEPCIPAATKIGAARMRPARDICFILVGNAERESVEFNSSRFGEVKNVFVAIVQEPR